MYGTILECLPLSKNLVQFSAGEEDARKFDGTKEKSGNKATRRGEN